MKLGADHLIILCTAYTGGRGWKRQTPAQHLHNSYAEQLLRLRLLKRGDGCYHTTARGAAMIKMLCDTPLPTPSTDVWQDPRDPGKRYHHYGFGAEFTVK